MESEKYLKSVKDNLEAAGFSVDDLVQFITEKAANSVQKFPFEVMYEGMVRSWVPLEGKKPLGVIFENYLITLKDSPVKLNWDEAQDYCRGVEIEGHTCTAGWIIFWKRVGRIPEKQRDELDNLLINLGGMALTGNWRWSRSKGNGSLQNGWCYACNVSNTYSWSCHYYVRPVLGL